MGTFLERFEKIGRVVDWAERGRTVVGWIGKAAPVWLPTVTALLGGVATAATDYPLVPAIALTAVAAMSVTGALYFAIRFWDHLRGRRPRISMSDVGASKAVMTSEDIGAFFVIRFAVSNMGFPTKLSDWEVYVTPPGGAEQRCTICVHHEVHIDGVLIPQDRFHTQLVDVPLEKGAQRTGNIAAMPPPSVTKEDLEAFGLACRVSVLDVFGGRHGGSFVFKMRPPRSVGRSVRVGRPYDRPESSGR